MNPDSTAPQDGPDQKRPLTRTELRAAERAFVADGYRSDKQAIAQRVANERGTLPDARELMKIHRARQSVTAALKEQQARASHPAGKALAAK